MFFLVLQPDAVSWYQAVSLQRWVHDQKIILIEDDLAGAGTVNLDNRSFFLNFEVMGFIADLRFVESVEKML